MCKIFWRNLLKNCHSLWFFLENKTFKFIIIILKNDALQKINHIIDEKNIRAGFTNLFFIQNEIINFVVTKW